MEFKKIFILREIFPWREYFLIDDWRLPCKKNLYSAKILNKLFLECVEYRVTMRFYIVTLPITLGS
jgi:hypothetical protein